MEMMGSIANLATNMSNAQVSVQMNTSLLKKAMDTQASAMETLFDSMPQTFPGDNGYMFDATA
ncbi:MAG: YjfB family protein [Oscillospiraceae bacterium]